MQSHRASLLRASQSMLRTLGFAVDHVQVTIDATISGETVRLRYSGGCREFTDNPAGNVPDDAWKMFSPLEDGIIAFARERAGWFTAEDLAANIGESTTGDLRPILRNLTARNVLESAQGRGYRLALPQCGKASAALRQS